MIRFLRFLFNRSMPESHTLADYDLCGPISGKRSQWIADEIEKSKRLDAQEDTK